MKWCKQACIDAGKAAAEVEKINVGANIGCTERHECPECGDVLTSAEDLAKHRALLHAIIPFARLFLYGNQCACCLVEFDNRTALAQHLRHARVCLVNTVMRCDPIPWVERAELDAADTNGNIAKRKAGFTRFHRHRVAEQARGARQRLYVPASYKPNSRAMKLACRSAAIAPEELFNYPLPGIADGDCVGLWKEVDYVREHLELRDVQDT